MGWLKGLDSNLLLVVDLLVSDVQIDETFSVVQEHFSDVFIYKLVCNLV